MSAGNDDTVVRPRQFQQREEDLHREKVYAQYKRDSEDRIARRVVELLREEGMLVSVPRSEGDNQ